jgi:hypothetical protein
MGVTHTIRQPARKGQCINDENVSRSITVDARVK